MTVFAGTGFWKRLLYLIWCRKYANSVRAQHMTLTDWVTLQWIYTAVILLVSNIISKGCCISIFSVFIYIFHNNSMQCHAHLYCCLQFLLFIVTGTRWRSQTVTESTHWLRIIGCVRNGILVHWILHSIHFKNSK